VGVIEYKCTYGNIEVKDSICSKDKSGICVTEPYIPPVNPPVNPPTPINPPADWCSIPRQGGGKKTIVDGCCDTANGWHRSGGGCCKYDSGRGGTICLQIP
ncbi:MAG: hypothetical protein HAW67_02370, partial [Endozoicomonadaceae bacterium]|nr:hypothetical protein [Endozoicomonadaceae bacterium]